MPIQKSNLGPLFFATSNNDKFLQARLLASWAGFEVRRLESHIRAYPEPYGLRREEFLRAGISDVVARAGASRLVFIEDTTVRIEALSSNGDDFPGQQTKEWFQTITHAELLEAIDTHAAGDRRAVVRSDIALHVPGLGRIILFAGETQGLIADEPADARVNAVYPWLGRRDFSSWFIPAGADRALSLMALEESLRFDFRAKALSALTERLREYEAVRGQAFAAPAGSQPGQWRDPLQMELFPGENSDLVLIVVGARAAGKSTIGHHLALNRSFTHVEGSRALAESATQHQITGDSSFELATRLFEVHGPDVVEREALPTHLTHRGPVVYTGCRTVEGLLTAKMLCDQHYRRSAMIYLTAPSSVRLARAADRARIGSEESPTAMAEADERDRGFGLLPYAELLADAVLKNDSADLGSLLFQVDQLIPRVRAGWRRSSQRRAQLSARLRQQEHRKVAEVMQGLSQDLVVGEGSEIRLTSRGEALVVLLTQASEAPTSGPPAEREHHLSDDQRTTSTLW